MALPTLAIFYYQPLMAAYKPHWSGPAYLILLLAACKIFLDGLQLFNKQILQPKSKALAAFALVFLIPLNLIYIPLVTPIIPKIYAMTNSDPGSWQPKWDFTNEFYGWKAVGEKVRQMQAQLGTADSKPQLGAQRYELISQLMYGADEKVWQLTFEKDQFHFDQPAADKQQLIGKNFLVVNNDKYPRDPKEISKFDSCEKTEFPFYRGQILARTFYIYFCKNYQGLN
jgi:dolichol-phosphate mannosyltransferase